jgi:alcohol dehydrogenase, propanol-preferring
VPEHIIKIPDDVSDEVAAPIMCSGATIYRGIKEAGLQPGQWVAFAGAGGGVGHMGVMYARAMGMRVIAIDGGSDKGEMCKRIGAEHFVDFTQVKDVNTEVIKLADGEGVHGLIVTASNGRAYAGAVGMVRTSGVMMCIGLPPTKDLPLIVDPITCASTSLPNLYWVNPYYRSPFEFIVLVPSFVI